MKKKTATATATASSVPTVAELRAQYKAIRDRSHEENAKAFDAACAKLVSDKSNAAQWVAAAKTARFMCRRCAGTGAFVTGSLNGQPTGPGGACYRCQGRGWQNDADARRNWGADNHAIAAAARGMCA